MLTRALFLKHVFIFIYLVGVGAGVPWPNVAVI